MKRIILGLLIVAFVTDFTKVGALPLMFVGILPIGWLHGSDGPGVILSLVILTGGLAAIYSGARDMSTDRKAEQETRAKLQRKNDESRRRHAEYVRSRGKKRTTASSD